MVARRVLIITALFGPPFGTAASLSAVIDELAITASQFWLFAKEERHEPSSPAS